MIYKGYSESILKQLLNEEESEYLDFKEDYNKDKIADLIHDILCMSNSNTVNDRYIIFGVNDQKEIVGYKNIFKQADIIDTLKNARLNREIYNYIELKQIKHQGKKIAILIVKNLPIKPFFLLKDYTKGKTTLREGVIYTKHKDTNTDKNRTATDNEIELMFRERFGLGLTPIDKFLKYLQDIDNWEEIQAPNEYDQYIEEDNIKTVSKMEYYYKPSPEFRIIHRDTQYKQAENIEDIENILPWIWYSNLELKTSGVNVNVNEYITQYNGYNIKLGDTDLIIWMVNNGRSPIPCPDKKNDNNGKKTYFISTTSPKFMLAKIITKFPSLNESSLEENLKRTKIEVID